MIGLRLRLRQVQQEDRSRRHERPRLRLCRRQGVVWGPIRDMVHVSHGPVGCGWYSWGTRRNLMTGINGVDQFAMQFTSDFQEKDIVYGGDKKLKTAAGRGQGALPAGQGDLGPVRVPGRSDR